MSDSANVPRTRTGCQNCRLRHLKCDDQQPSCSRCTKAGADCVREYNVRFKYEGIPRASFAKGSARGDRDFDRRQPWVRTARNLTFFDQTQELISIYDHAAEPETSYAALVRCEDAAGSTGLSTVDDYSAASDLSTGISKPFLPGETSTETDFEYMTNLSSPAKRRRLTLSSHNSLSPVDLHDVHNSTSSPSWLRSPNTGWTPAALNTITTADDNVGSVDVTGQDAMTSVHSRGSVTMSDSLGSIYLDAPVWPLESEEEARLLRYYVENLARSFDLTDPLRHFRNVVPQRAAICPTLLHAIFALSARHLSRVGQYDPLASNRYHQECLKHLIPMLDSTTAILDENLLASSIILRHLEEIEVPLSGQSPSDQQSHLLGAHTFIAAQEQATISGGLRQAAFWVGLRQEIYVAFVNQRSIIPALTHCNIDRSFDPAEDHIWACRMVVLFADIIRYCFGEAEQGSATHTYNHLADNVDHWYNCKPASFTPVFQAPANLGGGRVFPDLWYVGDEILTGMHYYHLARILLASYNPRVPRLGPGRAAALKAMDDEIRDHVRTLCGMCISNSSTRPNFTYASMGVTMAGDKFTDRREQEALLEVLEVCDRDHAWPTGAASRNLKLAWGWDEDI